MRYRVGVVGLVLLSSCGQDPGPTRADHEALLHRLDAMEQRIDVLEDAAQARAVVAAKPVAAGEPWRPTLPIPVAQVDPAAGPSLRIHVAPEGLRLDERSVTRKEAREHFERIASERPQTRLMVLADPGVPHQAVVDVLDLARDAGLDDIAMSARVHDSDAAP